MTLDELIARLAQRDLPNNPMQRIKTFARELATGAAYGLWDTWFYTTMEQLSEIPSDERIQRYVRERWGAYSTPPTLELLVQNGYLLMSEADRFSRRLTITQSAFALLDETEPAMIFISYKRSESSALALLVHDRLRAAGLAPFLDMQLQPGDNWPQRLQKSIETSDHLILLLSHTTLTSTVTQQELLWALAANVSILPIWHGGFSFEASAWPSLPHDLATLLSNTHTIRITEENPLAYNTALTELLNFFGLSG